MASTRAKINVRKPLLRCREWVKLESPFALESVELVSGEFELVEFECEEVEEGLLLLLLLLPLIGTVIFIPLEQCPGTPHMKK